MTKKPGPGGPIKVRIQKVMALRRILLPAFVLAPHKLPVPEIVDASWGRTGEWRRVKMKGDYVSDVCQTSSTFGPRGPWAKKFNNVRV